NTNDEPTSQSLTAGTRGRNASRQAAPALRRLRSKGDLVAVVCHSPSTVAFLVPDESQVEVRAFSFRGDTEVEIRLVRIHVVDKPRHEPVESAELAPFGRCPEVLRMCDEGGFVDDGSRNEPRTSHRDEELDRIGKPGGEEGEFGRTVRRRGAVALAEQGLLEVHERNPVHALAA